MPPIFNGKLLCIKQNNREQQKKKKKKNYSCDHDFAELKFQVETTGECPLHVQLLFWRLQTASGILFS